MIVINNQDREDGERVVRGPVSYLHNIYMISTHIYRYVDLCHDHAEAGLQVEEVMEAELLQLVTTHLVAAQQRLVVGDIYTVSTQYHTVSKQYLHSIYTISTHYLHSNLFSYTKFTHSRHDLHSIYTLSTH